MAPRRPRAGRKGCSGGSRRRGDATHDLRRNVDAIRDLGIGLSIDDFGTGHASILSLLRLRPDRLKIDRRFLEDVVASQSQRRLLRSLIDIGKSLDIRVVAEGVESIEQGQMLAELGCDILQGFALARPMPSQDLLRLLRSGAA